MAATVLIRRLTGSGPTVTDITSTTNRLSTSDSAAPGTANPIPIPAAGTNYSFWAATRLDITVAASNGVNNLKWYSDGSSFGTGLTCKMNTATNYVQATGTAGTTGTQLTTGNYATLAGAPADVTTFTSGSPKTVTGSATTGTGQFGDYAVYQLEVGTTAGVGTTTARTFTWSFDET